MEQCKCYGYVTDAEGDLMAKEQIKPYKVKKNCKPHYKVHGKPAKDADVTKNKTDGGGTFYVYNLYGNNDDILALNRYVIKDSADQPFDQLTAEEELVLNPV